MVNEKADISLKLLHEVFENSPIAMAIINSDKKIIKINNSFTKMLGYTSEDISNINLEQISTKMVSGTELIKKDGSKIRSLIHNKDIRTGDKEGYSIVQICDLGQQIKLENDLLIYQNRLEELVTERTIDLINVNRNLEQEIKDRKIAEYNAILFKQQIEITLQTTKTEILIVDNKSKIKYVDPQLSKKYGDYQNKKCQEYLKNCDEICLKCESTDLSIGEFELVDETERILKIVTVPFTDYNNDLLTAIIRIDVTEDRNNTKRMIESEERFRTLTEKSSDILLIIGKGHLINYCSPSIISTGFTPDELINQNLKKIIKPEDLDLVEQYYRLAIDHKGERIKTPAFRIKTKNEEILFFEGIFTCLYDQSGIQGLIFNGSDITEKKHVQDILEQAKVRAEKSARFKTDFLAYLSHEIRTPLNSILNMIELMFDDLSEADRFKYLEVQRNSCQNLMNLLNDVLDLAKVEAGAFILEKIPFDLHRLVTQTVDTWSISAKKKELNLYLEIDQTLPKMIVGDPTRLNQIINNLISNAIKFTIHGDIKVKLTNKSTNESECSILFEIIDQGIGISADKIATIFNRFAQEDASTIRKYGGTGLGLSLCKNFIEEMNGSIKVETVKDQGSNFYFTLTFPIADVTMIDNEDSRTTMANTTKKLLVVDDDADFINMIKLMLKNHAIDIITANNGVEALSKLKQNSCDAIATDLLMPKMDGIELIANIKKTYPHIPVILISGKATEQDLVRVLKLGAINVFQKPIINDDRFISTILEDMANGYNLKEKFNKINLPEGIGQLKILFVDDSIDGHILIDSLLKDLPFQISFASNGNEVLSLIKTTPLDIIFMDIQIPELDGLDTTREIRKFESKNNKKPIPIVALTGYTSSDDINQALDAGYNYYLTKPFKKIELINKIIQIWENDILQIKKIAS